MPQATEQRLKPPLSDSYALTVTVVLLAMCPNLITSTTFGLVQRDIVAALHTTRPALGLAPTFSNAGFAFGVVVAAQLAQRFPAHRLCLAFEAPFVLGSALSALAPGAALFVAGHILQGLATGLLLVIALPPLVTNYPFPGEWSANALHSSSCSHLLGV
jgi:predicted MFS family arabinose efflux permease